MKTQAQLSELGREGTAQSTWQRRARSYKPSSPFSLSTRLGQVEEPTNNETHPTNTAQNGPRARARINPFFMLSLCGGAAIRAMYTDKERAGRKTQ